MPQPLEVSCLHGENYLSIQFVTVLQCTLRYVNVPFGSAQFLPVFERIRSVVNAPMYRVELRPRKADAPMLETLPPVTQCVGGISQNYRRLFRGQLFLHYAHICPNIVLTQRPKMGIRNLTEGGNTRYLLEADTGLSVPAGEAATFPALLQQ